MYYTYILYSKIKDKFYIGSSENTHERLKKHNNKNKGFTNQSDDWKIIFSKAFVSRNEALLFERKIKNWKSRKMIMKLVSETKIDSERPDWKVGNVGGSNPSFPTSILRALSLLG